MAHHMQLAFEELVQQTLFPAQASPDMEVILEYAAADAQGTLTVRCADAVPESLLHEDRLPLTVLRGIASEPACSHHPGEARPFRITLEIKP
jgi:hypothetical protein